MTVVNLLRLGIFRLVVACILVGSGAYAGASEAASAKKVLFLPFNVQRAAEFSYLQDGSANMLACRVADRANIVVVNWSVAAGKLTTSWTAGQQDVFTRNIKGVDADFLVAGNLAFLKEGLEITVMVFDVATGRLRQNVTTIAADESEILTSMDQLSWDLVEKVFGGTRPGTSPQAGAAPKSCAIFQTPHPEREYKTSAQLKKTPAAPAPGADAIPRATAASGSSSALDLEIKGFALGDLNGDGGQELVAVSDTLLIIMRYHQGTFESLDTMALPHGLKIYAINLADLDENGRPEIYLAGSRGDQPSSWAVEWHATGQTSFLLKDIDYYLRPVTREHAARPATVLLGQEGRAGSLLDPAVYSLALSQHQLTIQERLALPPDINIFNFSRTDLNTDGKEELIAVDKQGRLRVLRGDGTTLWVSEEPYAEGKNYLGLDMVQLDQAVERNLLFVPTRIITTDVDHDGFPEVIIGKNTLSSSRFFKNSRWFAGATVVVLKWTGSAMKEMWQSEKIEGYISDYQFFPSREAPPADRKTADAPALGILYITQVSEGDFVRRMFSEKAESRILAYPLVFK